MPRPTLALPLHEQPRKKIAAPPPPKQERDEAPIRSALRSLRKEPPRPKLSIPPPTTPSSSEKSNRPRSATNGHHKAQSSTSKQMPLKEKNAVLSPRSQWVANVSQLKQNQATHGQSHPGAEASSSANNNSSTLSWNELEATLSKRMREPNVTTSKGGNRDRTSSSQNKARQQPQQQPQNTGTVTPSDNYHYPVPTTMHHHAHPPGTSNIPRLQIPKDEDRISPSKQQHSASSHEPHKKARGAVAVTATSPPMRPPPPSTAVTTASAQKVSRRTMVDPPSHHIASGPSIEFPSSPVVRRTPRTASVMDESSHTGAVASSREPATTLLPIVESTPIPTELTPMTPSFQGAVVTTNAPQQHQSTLPVSAAALLLPPVKEVITPRLSTTDEAAFNDVEGREPQKTMRGMGGAAATNTTTRHAEEINSSAQQQQQPPPSLETKADFLSAVANSMGAPASGLGTSDTEAKTIAAPAAASTSVALKKSRQPKPKKKMSWLRMALTSNNNAAAKQLQQQQQQQQVPSPPQESLSRAASSGTDAKSSKSNRSKRSHSSDVATPPAKDTVADPVPPPRVLKFTTPLQQLLWLSAVKKAIDEARPSPLTEPVATTSVPPPPATNQTRRAVSKEEKGAKEEVVVANGADVVPASDSILEATKTTDHPNYYNHMQDTGVYVDYSTFDDGDSVSSMELLFQWLTCRELNDGSKKQRNSSGASVNPPGTVVATDSNISEDLSIDMSAKPRRRTLFSR